MKISDIEGIGPTNEAKLVAAGVASVEKLLETAGPAAVRAALASATGISPDLLLQWTNHADPYRLNGVGSEYADLLEAAGVDSCPELAQRNATNLAARLGEINLEKSLTRRVPTETMVADWIAQAKDLPKVVTH